MTDQKNKKPTFAQKHPRKAPRGAANAATKDIKVENSAQDAQKVEQKGADELANKAAGLEKLVSELNDRLLRALAENDNLRKRAKEEVVKASKYALSNFASELVAVTEVFYLAMDNVPAAQAEQDPKIKSFTDAMVMTQKEMTKVLEKNGVKRLNPLGEKFDHNYHEAIAHLDGQGESGNVSKVVQAGYSINDRLIRPALVEVVK